MAISLTLTTADGQQLTADLALPSSDKTGGVVLCHPHPLYGGNRYNPMIEALFTALPQAGLAALRFDFRGEHDGGVAERLDLAAALDELEPCCPAAPLFVAGYSFGAVVALTTDDPRITGIVAIAPPLREPIPAPDAPVYLLAPRYDQYCSPEQHSTTTRGWPHLELDIVEGTDHFLAGKTGDIAGRATAWRSRMATSR